MPLFELDLAMAHRNRGMFHRPSDKGQLMFDFMEYRHDHVQREMPTTSSVDRDDHVSANFKHTNPHNGTCVVEMTPQEQRVGFTDETECIEQGQEVTSEDDASVATMGMHQVSQAQPCIGLCSTEHDLPPDAIENAVALCDPSTQDFFHTHCNSNVWGP